MEESEAISARLGDIYVAREDLRKLVDLGDNSDLGDVLEKAAAIIRELRAMHNCNYIHTHNRGVCNKCGWFSTKKGGE